jgi:phosphoribosylformylglycinamidine (FGAM) synthase PurS component
MKIAENINIFDIHMISKVSILHVERDENRETKHEINFITTQLLVNTKNYSFIEKKTQH